MRRPAPSASTDARFHARSAATMASFRSGFKSLSLGFALLAGASGAACQREERVKTVEVPVPGGVETKTLERDAPCPILLLDGLRAGREVECGYVTSPLERDGSSKRSVRVAYFRVKAKDGKGSKPPVVFHFGGPGDDGTNPARLAMKLREWLGTDRDLVAIGQRGTTFSLDIPACEEPDYTDADSAEAIAASAGAAAETCKNGLDASGLDANAFDTTAAVRDLEALRLGLEYGEIDFHGISYGTTFAIEYARQFPTTVRRLVLDSTLPPDFDRPTYFVDQFADTPAFLKSLTGACAQRIARCKQAFGGTVPDFAAAYEKVLADSTNAAIAPAAGVTLRSFELLAIARGAGMGADTRVAFAFFAHGLSVRTGRASPEGIDTGVLAALEAFRSAFGVEATPSEILASILGDGPDAGRAGSAGPFAPKGFSEGLNGALGCSEIFNVTRAEVDSALAAPDFATLGAAMKEAIRKLALIEDARCAPWRRTYEARSKAFAKGYTSRVQAIFVNSTFDTATPLKYARKAFTSFPRATLAETGCTAHGVLVDGLGVDELRCTASILRTMFDTGTFTEGDLACLCRG